MKNSIKWVILGLLLLVIFVLTLMKPPEAITETLQNVSKDVQSYSAFIHIMYVLVIFLGIFFEKIRNTLFSLFIAFLSLSATVISIKYMILPNIIIFGMFFVLIAHAFITKKLNFDLKNSSQLNLMIASLGLVFGFWYLHWVESPVWLNALIYSPLGAVNCPTMVTICGFLCLSQKPRSTMLEVAVSLITLYFGFFGIFRLGAYIDIVLVICALYLIVRLSSYLPYKENQKQRAWRQKDHRGDTNGETWDAPH